MATESDFTIADVLAWARSKRADEEYRYTDGIGGCALCQFLKDTGRASNPIIWPNYFANRNAGAWADSFRGEKSEYPHELEYPLQAGTFGALVTSLEALCPETPVTASNWLSIDAYLVERVEA